MSVVRFFNKGLARGTVTRSEMVEYEDRNKKKQEFLSMEIEAGDNNKIRGTMFPTKRNPNKALEAFEKYPIGSKVNVSGTVREQEYETKAGRKGINRDLNMLSIKPLKEGMKETATFIIHGIVDKIIEVEDGVEVKVRYENTYTPSGSDKSVTSIDMFTLTGDEETADLISDLDVIVGCNAKFKGYVLNRLVFDEFGDIIANEEMFKIERIENVVQPEDLQEMEEAPAFL